MTIKKRTISTITIGTDGATTTGSKTVSLGAAYGCVRKIEFKGDDTNVETSLAVLVTDAGGRIVYSDTIDGGGDDSTVKQTEQSYSTVGLGVYLVPVETEAIDRLGDPSADTEGVGGQGVFAESPLTFALSSGTDGDVYRIHVWVEV
jgi:hypothetical protein